IIRLIELYQPSHLAIEKVFVHRNVSAALTLGQARGVALLAAAQSALSINEYSPKTIKQAVVGNGNASKEQVQYMISMILKISKPLPDAADALAIALCHSFHREICS